jgi:O-antigen/teichoic acid export membrane protein
MTIAMRICMTALGMLVALSQPLWPAFTDAAHTADRRWIRQTLLRGSALLASVTVAGSAVLILFGQPLLRLWLHADLGIGQPLLWAISVWVLAEALARVQNLLLNALALVRFQIVVTAIATPLAWALKFALAPWLGVAGILWGTSVTALLIGIPAGIWRIYRWADHSARQEAMLT